MCRFRGGFIADITFYQLKIQQRIKACAIRIIARHTEDKNHVILLSLFKLASCGDGCRSFIFVTENDDSLRNSKASSSESLTFVLSET